MLGKFVWKKQANVKKGKGEKKKDKETKNISVFQEGVDGQEAKKQMEFWKGRQKENQKRKLNRKKRRILKTGLLGTNKEKKTLKLQENSLWVFFFQTKKIKHTKRKQNHQTTKSTNKQKNTFLHVGKHRAIFGKFVLFFKLHSFFSAKLCFAENTIKIVFSAEHSF